MVRVLLIDDFEPWRCYVRTMLQKQHQYEVIGEATDGLEGVRKAEELEPDLILLDIGLPELDGIAAARRIRQFVPHSRILFTSENRSWDIAEEALRTGAEGYLVKEDAAREFMIAVSAVLRGEKFLGRRFALIANWPNPSASP
jgi:DNA-binding NarL/FixJ family response regulator